jgi:fructose/tagatose bisphosphate aldolase
MPTIYSDLTSLKGNLQPHPDSLPDNLIDDLAYTANFAEKDDVKEYAQKTIREYAPKHGVIPSSIHKLYMAFAQGAVKGFSVPALNIRTLTYDIAHRVYETVITENIGPIIFEIALSEQDYTAQPPHVYAASVLAGAMRAHYKGPIFLLGDHYQLKAESFKKDKEAELRRLESAIRAALAAQFYNIDIDGSTLVDLSLPYEADQQKDNFEVTAYLAKLIRALQPEGITVAVGGEIGHIGGVNSKEEDLRAFMNGYIKNTDDDLPKLAKIAIQTGTSHGGTPEIDGSVAHVDVDTDLHTRLSSLLREEYGIGGTVQHGASTLSDDQFHVFPEKGAVEVHLATGWQNIIFETMPDNLKDQMYAWAYENLANHREKDWSDKQFLYKVRKRSLGQFKRDLWMMDQSAKEDVLEAFMKKFLFICNQLGVLNTRAILDRYIP